MNIPDTIDGARRAFDIAGRGCLVRMGEDEPRYATVAIAARLVPQRALGGVGVESHFFSPMPKSN